MKLILVACLSVFTMGVFINTVTSLDKTDIAAIWTLQEGKGDEITDSVNGVKGTFNGNPKWTDGKYGSGLQFNGSTDWVVTEDLEIFEFKAGNGFTLALWFKTKELPPEGESAFIGKGYADTTQLLPWYLLMYTDGKSPVTKGTVAMELRKEPGNQGFAIGQTEVNDGKWHHIAGVVEGNEARTYVDGVLDATVKCPEADYGTNDDPVIFMRQYDVGIIGAADEFTIIRKALNEAEIRELMLGADAILAIQPGGKLSTMWGELKSDR